MAVDTPDNAQQVEDRIKADVQREAPDSNPYLRVSWLRSLIAAFARRLFDFYKDLERTEDRLFPDGTLDEETTPRWGNIYVGPQNPATGSSGLAVAQGTPGSSITSGESLTADGQEYIATSSAVISDQVINVTEITRSGATATVTTPNNHNLASSVPVDITGASEIEYNVTNAAITVISETQFSYQVDGTPATPATGTITAAFTTAVIPVESVDFGSTTNLDGGSPLSLQQQVVGVDNTLNATFGGIAGGTDEESLSDYQNRYLDKIRNPVAHFNEADIEAKAKEVSGVTRVFVEPAGTSIGAISVSSLTRSGNVATVVTASDHGLDDGAETSISGAAEADYNATDTRIIVENATTFHYVVFGSPTTPATGAITADTKIPLGQVRTFFMRDNDEGPIPTQPEVDDVKEAIDSIRPANTASGDNIVSAPTANVTNYAFTELVPNTPTMQDAVTANLAQFHEERTQVGVDDDEQAYLAAITNTVDPDTGDQVQSFALSSPTGDLINGSGQIATLGMVTYP